MVLTCERESERQGGGGDTETRVRLIIVKCVKSLFLLRQRYVKTFSKV